MSLSHQCLSAPKMIHVARFSALAAACILSSDCLSPLHIRPQYQLLLTLPYLDPVQNHRHNR